MEQERDADRGITRREFIGTSLAGGAAIILTNRFAFAEATTQAAKKTDVWVFHGKDKKKLMGACMKVIDKNGGFGKDVKKLTLKVNSAWNRTPQQGANTHPELVDAFLKGCKGRGIKKPVIPENPCDSAKYSFVKSGLLDVAKSNGVAMIDLRSNKNLFKEMEIPKGKRLKKALVGKDFLETDALVNMPVAKSHGSAVLTIAMKNWLGSVWDRGYFHRNDLHQCIADFSTFIKPTWTIIDATRIMVSRGPKGPTKRPFKHLKHPDLLILSKDQVAADVYTTTLFPGKSIKSVRYLLIARDMKLGTTDLSKIAVHKIEVS